MINYPKINFSDLYHSFHSPIASLDCGQKCALHNQGGIPFCCDICQAIPAAYDSEWHYLNQNTDLWHVWDREDNLACERPLEKSEEDLPENMVLIACKGVQFCQRSFRALSCRQFPFFPYVTEDFRFIGLSFYWEFVHQCWVISHLEQVTETYRREFVQTFDELFNLWPEEMESYAIKSDEMRVAFIQNKQRIPILHRNGHDYLLSPGNETLRRVSANQFKKYKPYNNK